MQNSLKYLLPDISRTLSAPRLPRFLHSRLSISDPCLQTAPPGVGARRRVGVGGVALAASQGLGSSARRALNWQLGVAEHGGPAAATSRWSYTAGGRRRPARCPARDPASGGRRRGAGRPGLNPAFLRLARSPFSSAKRFRRRSGSRGGAGARTRLLLLALPCSLGSPLSRIRSRGGSGAGLAAEWGPARASSSWRPWAARPSPAPSDPPSSASSRGGLAWRRRFQGGGAPPRQRPRSRRPVRAVLCGRCVGAGQRRRARGEGAPPLLGRWRSAAPVEGGAGGGGGFPWPFDRRSDGRSFFG